MRITHIFFVILFLLFVFSINFYGKLLRPIQQFVSSSPTQMKYNKVTFIGDSRMRSMYLVFLNSFQNTTEADINPRRCMRKSRLQHGNDLICKNKEDTWEGCVEPNKAKQGCYYEDIEDKIIFARDCSWRNAKYRKWLGCEERYKKINNLYVEYKYTTMMFWSDPYLDGIVERIQIKNDTNNLYVIQTNGLTYFNGLKYPNQDKNSCHQFLLEIQNLLKRLQHINVVFVSDSFWPGLFIDYFKELKNFKQVKKETNVHNYFNLSSSQSIWNTLEDIANRNSSLGLYNFKFCALAEIIVKNNTNFKWIDAFSPSYWDYQTYDGQHFYPYIYKKQLQSLRTIMNF